MKKQAFWKWVFLAAFTLFSLYTVLPIKEKVRLGLDLAGGTSFTVQIDQEQLRRDLQAADPSRPADAIESEIATIMRDADARTVEVLRNRVDALGVNEPVIAPGKDPRILIQLPGADEKQRAEQAENKERAFLKFCLAHRDNTRLTANLFANNRVPEGHAILDGRYYVRTKEYETLIRDPDYARRLASFEAPPQHVFMLQPEKLRDGREVYTPCFVSTRSVLTGEMLKRADIGRDPMTGSVHVSLTFKPAGATLFAKITTQYAPGGSRNRNSDVGYQLAIVLDNTLYSAPVIREKIPSGRAQISGSFTMEEAALLRNILNAGSRRPPVKILGSA